MLQRHSFRATAEGGMAGARRHLQDEWENFFPHEWENCNHAQHPTGCYWDLLFATGQFLRLYLILAGS
eukprot:1140537-Pelagomonas_calceolata.AAC.1